jgi:hypothetical protein
MTGEEKRARMRDVTAAIENTREVLVRAVPRGFERRMLLADLAHVQEQAKASIWRSRK